jgi:hypothetical protein
MAGDINIRIKNELGGGGSETNGLKGKLSAKKTSKKNQDLIIEKVGKQLNGRIEPTTIQDALAYANNTTNVLSAFKKTAIVAVMSTALVKGAERVTSFGIDYSEALTGEAVLAHNRRALLSTITSGGSNIINGYIKNEIFTSKVIARQNRALDYGRELYNLNIEGQKNKIR